MIKISLIILTVLTMGNAVSAEEHWISLFNGKNLDGWIPKIKGTKLGENPGNIFRVQDGLLTVSYDAFDRFDNRFGHLFTDRPYTNFRFRLEYRFIGEQAKGGPKWAFRNNGIMLCCQPPETMGIDQSFPDSIEFQLLGAFDNGKPRGTGALFTPGTLVTYQGKDMKKSVKSSMPALPPNVWVKAEAVVKDGKIQHWINGKLVMEYSNPRYDNGKPATSGYIALQAESHPIQFRNIEILILD